MEDKCFLEGDVHINFIEERIDQLLPRQVVSEEEIAAAVAVLANHIGSEEVQAVIPRRKPETVSLWKLANRVRRLRRTL